MNIEKLEKILHQMQTAHFTDVAEASGRVREWADLIGAAITEHLMGEIGAAPVGDAPDLSVLPGGHGWDDDAG